MPKPSLAKLTVQAAKIAARSAAEDKNANPAYVRSLQQITLILEMLSIEGSLTALARKAEKRLKEKSPRVASADRGAT